MASATHSLCSLSRTTGLIASVLAFTASAIAFFAAFYFQQPYFSLPAAIGLLTSIYCGYELWFAKGLQEQVSTLKTTNMNLSKTQQKLEQTAQELGERIKDLNAEVDTLKNEMVQLHKIRELLCDVSNRIQKDSQKLTQNTEESQTLLSSIKETLNTAYELLKTIPLCNIQQFLDTVTQQRDATKKELQNLQLQITYFTKENENLSNLNQNLKQTQRELSTEVDKLQTYINNLQNRDNHVRITPTMASSP